MKATAVLSARVIKKEVDDPKKERNRSWEDLLKIERGRKRDATQIEKEN